MIKFLEIEQTQTTEEIDLGIPQEFFRLDITKKPAGEVKLIVDYIKKLIPNSKAYLHTCFHNEGMPKPCQREELVK